MPDRKAADLPKSRSNSRQRWSVESTARLVPRGVTGVGRSRPRRCCTAAKTPAPREVDSGADSKHSHPKGGAVAPGRHPITSSSKPHARGRRCLCLSSQDALTAFRPSALSSAGEGRVDIPLPLRGPPEGAQTLSWRRAKAFGCSSQPSGCLQPSHVGLAKPGAKAPRHGVVGLSELLSRFWGSKYVAGQQLPPALWVEVWAPGGPGAAL